MFSRLFYVLGRKQAWWEAKKGVDSLPFNIQRGDAGRC